LDGAWCWSGLEAPPSGEVYQLMVLWGDGVSVQPDPANHGRPTPGLAARVCLLGQNAGRSVAGDGSLSVHLYDTRVPMSEDAVPTEVWNIDPVNLQRLLSKDAVGWGYDLWLPWGTFKPDVSKVRLVVQYKSKAGREVWSSCTDYSVRRPSAFGSGLSAAPAEVRSGGVPGAAGGATVAAKASPAAVRY